MGTAGEARCAACVLDQMNRDKPASPAVVRSKTHAVDATSVVCLPGSVSSPWPLTPLLPMWRAVWPPTIGTFLPTWVPTPGRASQTDIITTCTTTVGFKEDGDRNDRLRKLVQGGYYERPNLNPSRGGADIRHNGHHRRPASARPPHSAARPSHGTAAVFGGFGSSLVPVGASHVDGSASRRPLAESVVAAPRRVTLVMAGEVARTTALQSQHFNDLTAAESIA